jgi:hypothetical protein
MSITNRLLAPIASHDGRNKIASVDLGAFVRRLLLFETYILHSGWLEDLALLTESFDESGLEQLLSEGALKLHCGVFAIGQTGQIRADLNFADNNKRLPLGSYSFSSIRVHGRDEKIERSLSGFRSGLRDQARRNLVPIPEDFFSNVFEGFYSDIRSSPAGLDSSVRIRLRKLGIKPKRLKLRVEETSPEDFRVENNLSEEYGLSPTASHKLIEGALLAVGGLNQRFAEMMAFSALSGTGRDDLPILQGKLSLVANLVASVNHEQRFGRVLNIAGLPAPKIGETKIDAEKLLRVRESDECRAFRDWLGRTDSLSDRELAERLTGLSARIRQALNTRLGKHVRLVVSNGLGLLGPITGLTASAVDSFILERLAPRDAILAFLSESYQPLFKRAS